MDLHKKCATTHIETEAALQLPNAKVNTFADIHKKMNIKKEVGAGCYQPHKRFRKIPKS